jgi:CubicO group peptidase (beta-lactamase class C family)
MENKHFIQALLMQGVETSVFPGAVLLVARGGRIVFHGKTGNGSLTPQAVPIRKDTIFDLASLTKPLATTLAAMKLVSDGTVHLEQSLDTLLPPNLPKEKKRITLRQLLSHSGGFPDWKPYYFELIKYEQHRRKGILRNRIIQEPLVFQPGRDCLYSDLGFMIMEWVIEEAAQIKMHQFLDLHFYAPLSLKKTFLAGTGVSTQYKKSQYAATEDSPWRKRVVQGEVHDENAFSVGGYSGHAGLFGTAHDVLVIVELLRAHYRGEREDYFKPQVVRSFFERQNIAVNTTWASGWDTPSPQNSSSGKHFSSKSVGHLGFTGTSVWMDLDKDVIVILLTNRVHPTRKNEKIKTFRPMLHDTVMEAMGID